MILFLRSLFISTAVFLGAVTALATENPSALLDKLNSEYLALHKAKELGLWGLYMNLSSYKQGDFESSEKALSDWRTSSQYVLQIRSALQSTISDAKVREGLREWDEFFTVHAFPDPALHKVVEETIALEGTLGEMKAKQKLSYRDSHTGKEVFVTQTALREVIGADPVESHRKSAWESLSKMEKEVLQSTYIDIIKNRREFGKLSGKSSFYDYRTQATEKMTEAEVFAVLDDLEKATRAPAQAWLSKIASEKGADSLKPWNLSFASRGELQTKIDSYFPFSDAVRRWALSFSRMGIDYREGKFVIDLIDRAGKKQNGFIRAREPGYFNVATGKHSPVYANFTSNGVIGKVGAGHSALRTLLHEGGHGAHFANIETPAVAGSQEDAPTSIAGAETQAMFLDHLLYDPIWLKRYATQKDGSEMPDDLIEQIVLNHQSSLAYRLRELMVVPYFERELYSVPESELTEDRILKIARNVEKKLVFTDGSPRPVLTVFHTHSSEAAAYYHGYVMAELGVWQTADYLNKQFGHIADNPKIGPALAQAYWKPGNSIGFSKMIERLTGAPFSAKATNEWTGKSAQEVSSFVQQMLTKEKKLARLTGPIRLNAQFVLADGDLIIAETSATKSAEAAAQDFADEIEKRENAKP